MVRNRARRICATALVLFLAPLAIGAGEVIKSVVERRGEHFIVHSEVLIQVPESRVRAILTQYENLPQVNPGIKAVQILTRRGNGQVRMRVVSEVCILVICLDYAWVQEVRTLPDNDIEAVIDPAESSFKEGEARWRLVAENGGTRLVFSADLVPSFWFPPGIGPLIIKHKLAREVLETALEVERLGQASP